MRVLDRESIQLALSTMGFSEDTLQRYLGLLAAPRVLLVTGPPARARPPRCMHRWRRWIRNR